MPRLSFAAALSLAPLVLQSPKSQPLDGKTRAAIEALANDWFMARPATAFDEWDPAVKSALDERVKSLDAIPSSSEKEIRAILWKAARKHGPRLDAKSPLTTKWGKAA